MHERPLLSVKSLEMLDAEFASDLENLSKLLGCDADPDIHGANNLYDWIRKVIPRNRMTGNPGATIGPKGNWQSG